jgi:hypothetical protein
MIRADIGREIKPELGELGENLSLIGNQRGEDEIKGRNPVGGDEKQLVAEIVNIPDLPPLEKRIFGDLNIGDGYIHSSLRIKKTPSKSNRSELDVLSLFLLAADIRIQTGVAPLEKRPMKAKPESRFLITEP